MTPAGRGDQLVVSARDRNWRVDVLDVDGDPDDRPGRELDRVLSCATVPNGTPCRVEEGPGGRWFRFKQSGSLWRLTAVREL